MKKTSYFAHTLITLKYCCSMIRLQHIVFASLGIYFFLTPFSNSRFILSLTRPIPTSVLLTYSTAFVLISYYFCNWYTRIHFDKFLKITVSTFFLSMFLSIAIVPFNIVNVEIPLYVKLYLSSEYPKRILQICFYFIVICFGWVFLRNFSERKLKGIIHCYFAGIFLLALIGFWQWLSFHFPVPYPDLETRSHVISSFGSEIFSFIPGRVTSLSSEPAFFAPYILDGLILCFYLFLSKQSKRKILSVFFFLLPLVWVLVFSYSTGGFISFVAMCALLVCIEFYKDFKIALKRLSVSRNRFLFGLIFLFSGPFWVVVARNVFGGHLFRLAKYVVDYETSTRIWILVNPFVWVTESGYLSALLGFGPGAFAIIPTYKMRLSGEPAPNTSNNVYADIVFENGYIGLILFMVFILYLFFYGAKRYHFNESFRCGMLLTANLIITSLYRPDFMSPRFWVVVMIVFICYEIGDRQLQYRQQSQNKIKPSG